MKDYQPYIFSQRRQMLESFYAQTKYFGREDLNSEIQGIVYNGNWDILKDFNGCNMIQDKFHPYLPCVFHDYYAHIGQGGYKNDVRFRKLLIDFGTKKGRAWRMFLGVRLGWLFYYKWKK